MLRRRPSLLKSFQQTPSPTYEVHRFALDEKGWGSPTGVSVTKVSVQVSRISSVRMTEMGVRDDTSTTTTTDEQSVGDGNAERHMENGRPVAPVRSDFAGYWR